MNSKLIEKFYRKECTPEEVKQVLEWFSDQSLQPSKNNDLRTIWENQEEEQQHDPKELLELIHQKIDQKNKAPSGTISSRHQIRLFDSRVYAFRVAAILFISFLFSWLFLNFTKKAIKPLELVTIEIPAGMKRTKILPDGSKVVLNSRSTITYSSGFNKSQREIFLVGEAFFEVAKDSVRPFTVHSGDLSTTALGTSFNINYQPSKALTEVSLATGVVQVSIKDKSDKIKSAKLQLGERLTHDKNNASFHIDDFDAMEILAWKEGVLFFKKAGIEQIVQRLEDWYDVEIYLIGDAGKIDSQDWTYTGMFKNQNLENVLTGIGYVKNISFEINGKNVKLVFN